MFKSTDIKRINAITDKTVAVENDMRLVKVGRYKYQIRIDLPELPKLRGETVMEHGARTLEAWYRKPK